MWVEVGRLCLINQCDQLRPGWSVAGSLTTKLSPSRPDVCRARAGPCSVLSSLQTPPLSPLQSKFPTRWGCLPHTDTDRHTLSHGVIMSGSGVGGGGKSPGQDSYIFATDSAMSMECLFSFLFFCLIIRSIYPNSRPALFSISNWPWLTMISPTSHCKRTPFL